MKRLRWIVMGIGLGAGGSAWLRLRMRRLARRWAPPEVAARAAARAGDTAGRTADAIKGALAEGRDAMRRREDQLRDDLDARRAHVQFKGAGAGGYAPPS